MPDSPVQISPLTQITPENVAQLQPIWIVPTGGENRGLEATPLVHEGMIYMAADESRVFAIDAKTGVIDFRAGPSPERFRLIPIRVVALSTRRTLVSFILIEGPDEPDDAFARRRERLQRAADALLKRFGGGEPTESSQSAGGFGVLPAMMSLICCSSIVSYLMSACAIASSLSRFVSRMFCAFLYAVSMTRRTSTSMTCAVSSDTCLCCVTWRPRNTSPLSSE